MNTGMNTSMSTLTLHLWRHPRPQGAEGRCIGQTDIPVDRRRAKRLAHRIRAQARRQGWPRVVHSSPLRRCADVGRWLKRWGWRHHTHPALMELHFGQWDGQAWSQISPAEVDAWCADFAALRPGGTESLNELCTRLQNWAMAMAMPAPLLIVGHAGCMQALSWMAAHPDWASSAAHQPRADQWAPAPRYLEHLTIPLAPANGLHCAPSRNPAPDSP
jgi:alpha-ribazole phosphatase